MKPKDLLMLFCILLAFLAIPLTLFEIKISQDLKSQALAEPPSLPTLPPISSPTPVFPERAGSPSNF